jgi:hypothetical protein
MQTRRLIAAFAGLLAMTATAAAQSGSYSKVTLKKGAFADVQQDVSEAIVNRGLVIDYTAKIGDMLSRTAKDVGATKEIYKNAVAFQFCSAKLSRDMMEADPSSIALCPYVITVYELAAKPGIVHVAYRRFPSSGGKAARKSVAAVQQTLDEIIAKAVK